MYDVFIEDLKNPDFIFEISVDNNHKSDDMIYKKVLWSIFPKSYLKATTEQLEMYLQWVKKRCEFSTLSYRKFPNDYKGEYLVYNTKCCKSKCGHAADVDVDYKRWLIPSYMILHNEPPVKNN